MCFCYEIQVPENYTALSGDLEVTIIDLLRTPSDSVRLELLEVEFVRTQSEKLKKREVETMPEPPIHHGALIKFIDTRNETILRNLTNSNATNESGISDKTELKSFSRTLENVKTQIPQIKVEKKWTVLGTVMVPENKSGDGRLVKVKFPCGVVTRGGHFGVRLTGYDENINNLTNKHRNRRIHKTGINSRVDEVSKLKKSQKFNFIIFFCN